MEEGWELICFLGYESFDHWHTDDILLYDKSWGFMFSLIMKYLTFGILMIYYYTINPGDSMKSI